MRNLFFKKLLLRSTFLVLTCPWAVAAGTIRIEEFNVTPQTLALGGSFEVRARLRDGTLVYTTHYSTDEGRTWLSRESGTIGAGAAQKGDRTATELPAP